MDHVLVIAAVAGVAFVAIVKTGSAQREQAGGTLRRLFGVAFVGALLSCAPLGADALVSNADDGPSFVAGIWSVFSIVFLALLTGPAIRRPRKHGPLPAVEDPAILDRVAEIAGRLGIAPPRVRLLGSASASLATQAFAGGLAAPSLIVSDGILDRLRPDERDAILAHEMAHISTGSLWGYAVLAPLTGATAVLLGHALSDGTGFLFSCVVWVGFRRLFSRLVETACDLAGAKAIGHGAMAAALSKIHAAHVLVDRGWISQLAYATATHPARASRLEALRRDVPPHEAEWIAVDGVALRRHRRLSLAALAVWLIVVAATAVLARRLARTAVTDVVFAIVSLAPTLFLLLARKKRHRDAARRLARETRTWRWWALVGAATVGTVSVLTLRFLVEGPHSRIANVVALTCLGSLMAALLVLTIVFASLARRNVTRAAVQHALRDRDWKRALDLADRRPKLLRRDPAVRIDVALARAAAGDATTAATDLEELASARPRMTVALVRAAAILVDLDAERALACTREATRRGSNDPAVRVTAARALRRLGRGDDAADEAAAARALDPEGADVDAIEALLAVDRRNLAEARRLVDRALQSAPGDAFVLIASAALAGSSGEGAEVEAAIGAARSAVAASPLAFLGGELRAVEERSTESTKTMKEGMHARP